MREMWVTGLLLLTLLTFVACMPVPVSTSTPTVTKALKEASGYVYNRKGAIYYGGDGKPILLINNPNARDPTYSELVAFIVKDTTDSESYIKGGPEAHVCADFAKEVHNNAEAAGIRAAWVSISFDGNTEGHACNAFNTVDKGLVYIDCVGRLVKTWTGTSYSYFTKQPRTSTNWDKVAYLEVGKEYGVIGILYARSLQYEFFVQYSQKWQDYERMLKDYNQEVERYNQETTGKVYYEGSPELARIQAWGAQLEREKQFLNALKEELGDYRYELPGVSGIVNDVEIHW